VTDETPPLVHRSRRSHGDSSGHGQLRRHRRRGKRLALAVVVILVLLGATGAALAAFRYLPALDDARALKTELEAMVTQVKTAGLGLGRADLTSIQSQLTDAQAKFQRLDALLAGDPLVAVARVIPPSRDAVLGADAVTGAGGDLMAAASGAMRLADKFVTIKEAQAAGATGGTALAQLVELMATGRSDADAVIKAADSATTKLAAAPMDLPAPIASVRDMLAAKLAEYLPPLRAYAQLDDVLPSVLGWDAPRRYLVLTQNPAELRPTGGFIGSFGVIAFDKGKITERHFQDVFLLDLPWDYPFVTSPVALERYLLGPTQPWQLADANWSPDFPTSAQQAIALYANEGGPGTLDGVLAITTYTIDELLRITGPVTVPEYGVTIASGETTLKVLQNTRVAVPGESRKAFLGVFADKLFSTLFSLSPSRWADLSGRGDAFLGERLLLAWFENPADQAGITTLGLDGAVRKDAGDYIYPVDSNVAPTSKLNAVTDRSLELEVRLDNVGNAENAMTVTWTNNIETDAARPFRELPRLEKVRTLGMYFRLLVPERSRLVSMAGGSTQPITAPTDVADESGRMVIGNYFRIPPGKAHIDYTWISPYPANQAEDGTFTYQLTVQKQPGLRAGSISLRIHLPVGALVVDASPGLTVVGPLLSAETTFNRDLVVVVRYRLHAKEATQ
jgi:hypothetical protein